MLQEADAFIRQKDYEHALDTIAKALELAPSNPFILALSTYVSLLKEKESLKGQNKTKPGKVLVRKVAQRQEKVIYQEKSFVQVSVVPEHEITSTFFDEILEKAEKYLLAGHYNQV